MRLHPALPILLLSLAGCERPSAPAAGSAGEALEQAAVRAGVVPDPATLDPVGAYASDTDRVCVSGGRDGRRIGASIDYGDRQSCIARGSASGGETLRIDFGDGCRFEARFDGERITFAPAVPAACERRCSGRTSLAALTAPRLSGSATEARAMRAPDGTLLCS